MVTRTERSFAGTTIKASESDGGFDAKERSAYGIHHDAFRYRISMQLVRAFCWIYYLSASNLAQDYYHTSAHPPSCRIGHACA